MSKLDEAKTILAALQVPLRQQSMPCCCALLALAGIKETISWSKASNEWLRIHDVIIFANSYLGTSYAENSRESFRKQAMHHFRNAAFIEDNGKATNSANYRYRLTDEMLDLIRSFGSKQWATKIEAFRNNHETLISLYASKRKLDKIPIKINVTDLVFSSGAHNKLQKAIIEEFAPRFAPQAECLYIGDTANKDLVKNERKLKHLGLNLSLHDKLPDVVLYLKNKHCLIFIEAVTSVGPMDPKRVQEINSMTASVKIGKIYITAFPNFKTFKQFADKLAWDTAVWIADVPDHIIHYNGRMALTPHP